ncbi:hypothetical protein A0H81_10573 [Grifola frondosa]|uniref:Uncharacterized protein n=1 Tax=Grifola frondosa TaxID=5627 RepID=A0A1C7M343_GRIFR|nr:hypothetical protein A0H81_10573 [Grifola frondosa]
MYFTAYPYDHRIHRDMKSGEYPFKQTIHTLYDHPNKEALYAICDTSLEEARWEEQYSYHNEGIDMDRAFQIAAAS